MLETLQNIKYDLEKTAAHLESLSEAMSGHLIYLTQRGGHVDGIDVKDHIDSINSSAQVLRHVASKIDEDGEESEMVDPVALLPHTVPCFERDTV